MTTDEKVININSAKERRKSFILYPEKRYEISGSFLILLYRFAQFMSQGGIKKSEMEFIGYISTILSLIVTEKWTEVKKEELKKTENPKEEE